MFRRFSLRDVSRTFPLKDFERGRSYFEQGRVRHFNVTEHPGGTLGVRGEVLGSGGRVYTQDIEIEWDGDGLDVFSSCTCPVGFDCKHVVAVCLMVRRFLAGAVEAEQADAAEARLRRWLERIDQAGGTAGSAGERERLIYVLVPREARRLGVGVELRRVRMRRDGSVGKGRLVRMDRVVDAMERPSYVGPEDDQVVRLLGALCPEIWNLRPELRGRLGFMALDHMVATGRCTFSSADGQPLTWGDERALEVEWRETDDGRLGLELFAGSDSYVLATDPPLYVDADSNRIGRLETPLRPEQLSELISAPALLAGDAGAVARLLTNEFPQLPLPPPLEGRAEAQRHELIPCLTLTGGAAQTARSHELQLAFEYGGHRVRAVPATLQSLVETSEGPVRLHRDLEAESRARERLTAAGFELSPTASSASDLRLEPAADTDIESASLWSALVHDLLPELRRDGWRIRQDETFRLRFESGDWGGEVTPTPEAPNDWFSLRFDLEVNGERWPLLPLLMPLLAQGFDRPLPPRVSIPLSAPGDADYRCVDLPTERLRPFLATLHDLFDDQHFAGDGERIALSRFDAEVVGRLQSQGTEITAPRRMMEVARRLADFSGIRRVPAPAGLRAELRSYQQQGLDWLQFLREYELGGILADDMGLGKTVQTLAHLLVEKEAGRLDRPALIIAPTSLMSNWRREAERFAPALSVLVLHGTARRADFPRIPAHDLVLTTYPLLPRDRGDLEQHAYHALILDEAQTVKNPRSKAAVAVRSLEARHRLCLTGTPMENHLGELWTQFDFLLPGFLGNEEQFRAQWRRPIEEHGDEERQQTLARRVAPFMLRRRKQDVLSDLPPKTEIVRTVSLGEKQAGLYESVRLAMDEKVRRAIAAQGLARSHITILDALLKLRQICCDPRLLSLEAAREVKTSAKLELLMQMLPAMLEAGRRVLVFSQFTSMLELIAAELRRRSITYSQLTGQTRDRDRAVECFRSAQADVFLISLKAGGVGLNLVEADTVILYDPWWNPAVEAQAADRAHRIGQSQQVFVYQLVTEGTVEEKILALQERKRALADGVYSREAGADGAPFGPEELQALLAPLG